MFKKLMLRTVKVIWAIFATSVLLLAVFISILKYALPLLEDYKLDIETYLLAEFDAQVSIGQLSATWQTSGPMLVVDDLTLTPSKSAPLDISIGQTRIEVDFWRSISQQKLVTEAFLLDGIKARVNSEVFFKVRPNSQGNQLFESLSHLFLSQVYSFKVINSDIIVDHKTGRAQSYQIDNLIWVNQGNRHQGQGEVFVDGFSNNSLTVLVDLYGQRREDIFGEIYAEANKMDVSPWLTQVVGEHVNITKTEANFKVWGEVSSGVVKSWIMDVADTGVNWRFAQKDKFLKVDTARLHWWKSGPEWILFSNKVRLKTESLIQSPFLFSLNAGVDNAKLTMKNIELASLSSLFTLFSATQKLDALANSKIDGVLTEAEFNWGKSSPLSAYVELDHLSYKPEVQPGKAYLGATDINVKGYWLDQQGWFELKGEQGQLLTGDTFSKPLNYNELTLFSHVMTSELGTRVSIPKAQLINNDLTLNLTAAINSYQQTHFDLYAELEGPQQGTINQYLPRHVLSDNVYSYLDKAIQQGRGEITQVILSGDPSYMPFSDLNQSSQHGIFWVNAEIRDALFKFDPDWPSIEHMDANLTVENSLMSINAKAGQFAKLTVNNDVTAIIPLDQPNIALDLKLKPKQVAFSAFHDLTENTPLNDPLGDIFEFVKLSGQADANVEIIIPISNTEDEVQVNGSVVTQSASMSLPAINLTFTDVASNVTFDNAYFSVSAQDAKIFGLPVQFDVSGEPEQENYLINANVNGTWHQNKIAELYPMPLMDYFSGDFYTNLDVKVNIEGDGYQYYVDGKSDLLNSSYEVAGPLSKKLGQPQLLDISVIGDQESNDIDVRIDDLVSFIAVIPNETARIERAHLSVGEDNKGLPLDGFDIAINVDTMEFEPTLNFVLDIINSLPSDSNEGPGVIDAPSFVGGNIQSFKILGQNWQNVSLNAKAQPEHWLFSVGAQQTLSEIKVFNDVASKGIDIHSTFLQLNLGDDDESDGESQKPAEPDLTSFNSAQLINSLPPIKFLCDECSLDGKPLGKLALVAHANDNNLLIDNFSMDYKRNSANFKGSWKGNEGTGKTFLKGEVKSRYFGQWLLEYGLDSGIKDSNADIDLTVNWLGAPHQFNFATLNGDSNFKLGEGYLSEVSDQGARIFSLFSLDSLYRKLKFDFNDVFSKGLFYNDIKGSAQFINGVVESDDIKMDGIAGDMDIEGFTDLNQSILDYNVSFKPKVTSSLGVLSWLAASNPVTIIGAFALDKIIEEADVVSEIKLKISGELNSPKVEEVKRFTKRVKIPQPVNNTNGTEQEDNKPIKNGDSEPSTQPQLKGQVQ